MRFCDTTTGIGPSFQTHAQKHGNKNGWHTVVEVEVSSWLDCYCKWLSFPAVAWTNYVDCKHLGSFLMLKHGYDP